MDQVLRHTASFRRVTPGVVFLIALMAPVWTFGFLMGLRIG